jgi:hypothetical protein
MAKKSATGEKWQGNIYADALVEGKYFSYVDLENDGLTEDDIIDLCNQLEIEVEAPAKKGKAKVEEKPAAKKKTPVIVEEEEEEDEEEEDDEEEIVVKKSAKKKPVEEKPAKSASKKKAVVVEEEEEDDEEEEEEMIKKVATSSAAKEKIAKRESATEKMDVSPFKAVLTLFPESEGYVHNALTRGVTIKKSGKGVVSLDYFKNKGDKFIGNLYFNAFKGKEECEKHLPEEWLEEHPLSRFSPNLWFALGLTVKECLAILKEIKGVLSSKASKTEKALSENMEKMRNAKGGSVKAVETAKVKKSTVYEAPEVEDEEEEDEDEAPVVVKKSVKKAEVPAKGKTAKKK